MVQSPIIVRPYLGKYQNEAKNKFYYLSFAAKVLNFALFGKCALLLHVNVTIAIGVKITDGILFSVWANHGFGLRLGLD